MKKPIGQTVGWIQKSSRTLIETPWMRVQEDKVNANGRDITYTYIEHAGACFVVPVTKDNRLVVVRMYRYTVDEWCWEIPSGGIGDKQGRSLEQIAREEMKEEAGCEGGSIEYLGSFFTANGIMNLKAHFFLARDVSLAEAKPEESECIDRIDLLTLEEALDAVRTGRINDGESAFGVLLAATRLSAQR